MDVLPAVAVVCHGGMLELLLLMLLTNLQDKHGGTNILPIVFKCFYKLQGSDERMGFLGTIIAVNICFREIPIPVQLDWKYYEQIATNQSISSMHVIILSRRYTVLDWIHV